MEAAVFVHRQTWSFNPPWLFIWCVVLEKGSFSELHFIILEKSEGIRDNDVKDLTWAPELWYSALDAHRTLVSLWNSDVKAAAQASSTRPLGAGPRHRGLLKLPRGFRHAPGLKTSGWARGVQLYSSEAPVPIVWKSRSGGISQA